jgi:hypothetical protein
MLKRLFGVVAAATVAAVCVLVTQVTPVVRAVPVPSDVNAALSVASPGSTVDLSSLKMDQSADILNSHAWGLDLATSGGYLVYSDDPETVKAYGILYEETVPVSSVSAARFYIYHVNGIAKTAAKIAAVLTNPSTTNSITASYSHKSLVEPSSDYLSVGAEGVKLFYDVSSSKLPTSVTIPPSGSVLLDAELDSTVVNYEELLSAVYDVTSSNVDATLKVTIVMLPTPAVTLKEFTSYGFSPKDGYNRLGTFFNNKKTNPADVVYTHDLSIGAKYFEIASNLKYTSNDAPLTGISSFDNSSVVLNGNYGVEYVLNVQVNNDLDVAAKYAAVLNPRGGDYTGYVRINSGTIQYIPLVGSTSIGAVCGFVAVASGQSAVDVTIEFMPAGSTSLPVWLLLLPVV